MSPSRFAPFGTNGSATGITQYSYSGQTTTSTDPAGKKRQTSLDGAGRLSAVVEDPSGLNYSTSYTYDALDDLTGVTQTSQTRTFSYDSLQRLGSAVNPESSTIGYTYDASGNLLSKTDNRGFTTGYSYDALNRLITKTYPSGGGTPNVSYSYCNSSACGVSYGVGRIMSVSTSAGNSTNYTSYDILGRVPPAIR